MILTIWFYSKRYIDEVEIFYLKALDILSFRYWEDGMDSAIDPRKLLLPATDPLACYHWSYWWKFVTFVSITIWGEVSIETSYHFLDFNLITTFTYQRTALSVAFNTKLITYWIWSSAFSTTSYLAQIFVSFSISYLTIHTGNRNGEGLHENSIIQYLKM